VICGLSLTLAGHGFDEYDMSPMIDSGWRVFSGQVPGRDFLVTFPPSVYLLTALFFWIFGVTWHAMSLGACLVYVALFLLGLRVSALVRNTQGTFVAVWTAYAYCAALTIPFIIMNVIWHSELAMNFSIYAIYATFVIAGHATLSARIKREALVHLTLAIALLLLSKANTAYPAIVLCLVVVDRSGVRRRTLAAMTLSSVALASLALASVKVTLPTMMLAYTGLAGRIVPKAYFSGIFYNLNARSGLADLLTYAVLAPALVLICKRTWQGRQKVLKNTVALLAVGSILISLLAMGTNLTFKLSDSPLAIVGITFLALRRDLPYIELRQRAVFAIGTLLFTAIYLGRTKLAFQMAGGWFKEGCYQKSFDDPFFGQIKSCQVMPEALQEADQVLAAYPNAHVFFGPSLEFLYAARKLPSPLHLPNWWDPGTSYPLKKADLISKSWKSEHFDLLIFKDDEDRPQLPAGIRETLSSTYARLGDTRLIHVYRLRTSK